MAAASGAAHRRSTTISTPASTKEQERAFEDALDRVYNAHASVSSVSTLRAQLSQVLPTIRAIVRSSGGLEAQRIVIKSLMDATDDEEKRINAEEVSGNMVKFLTGWVAWNEAYQTWKGASLPKPAAVSAPAASQPQPNGASSISPPPPQANGTASSAAPPPAAPSPPPPLPSAQPPSSSTGPAAANGPKPVIPLPVEVANEIPRYRRDEEHPDLPPLLSLEECADVRRLMTQTRLLRFRSRSHERGGNGMITEAQAAIWPVRFNFIFDEQEGIVWKCQLTAELIVDDKTKKARPIAIIDRSEEKLNAPAVVNRNHLVQAGRWLYAAPLTQDAFLFFLVYVVAAGDEQLVSNLMKYLRTQVPPSK